MDNLLFGFISQTFTNATKKLLFCRISDGEIISLIRKRDEAGLKALYNNYSHSIFGVLLRTTRNRELSEEILQQTMLKAWNKIDTYNGEKSKLYTWLSTIARNSAYDKMRLSSYSQKNKTDSIDNAVHNIKGITFGQSDIDAQKLIKGLDEKYSSILRLIYLEGYTHVDAAEKLGIPSGTLKTRLRNAIKILREELKDERWLFLGASIIPLITILILL